MPPRRTDALYIAPPAQRAVRLLRAVVEGDTVTNTSVTAKALGINRTTLIRLLCTLEAERFIERRPGGDGFQVGVGFIGLAARALAGQDLVQVATPVLARLSEAFGLSAHLGVLDGHDVLYLLRRAPDLPVVSNIRVGSRLPAHATTMGRIILAHLPAAAVTALYGRGALKAFTDKTATTLAKLEAQIAADRAAGLAWSRENFEPGIDSVAAAVLGPAGAVVAAINVTGPSGQFPAAGAAKTRLGVAVHEAAAEISTRLGHVFPGAADPGRSGTDLAKSAAASEDRAPRRARPAAKPSSGTKTRTKTRTKKSPRV
ncbi:IclR family transcriptional regulator [Rhodoplanes sp. SY1]|uniref:IclR family transcriptional regulator n=1 Tax=Rhodoplanes sp. SY1 TaxID=3166646 RepID=UPI0038B4C4E4